MEVTLANKLSPNLNAISLSWATDPQLRLGGNSFCCLLGEHKTRRVLLRGINFQQLGYDTKLFQKNSGRIIQKFSYHSGQSADKNSHTRTCIQVHRPTCLPEQVKSNLDPLANSSELGFDIRPKVASAEQSSPARSSALKTICVRGTVIFNSNGWT